MMIPWCPDEACGRPSDRGHPRRGWVQVKMAGDGSAALWFCGPAHAAVALLDEAALTATPIPTEEMPRALKLLNQLGGTYLTIMTATPDRIRTCLDRACARIVAEVTLEAARQERRRPSWSATDAPGVGSSAP